jgi:hypothetical protein
MVVSLAVFFSFWVKIGLAVDATDIKLFSSWDKHQGSIPVSPSYIPVFLCFLRTSHNCLKEITVIFHRASLWPGNTFGP